MRNIQNFTIVSTFLCLWLAVYLSDSLETYLACFFILSIGLIHGANDIKIIQNVYKKKNLSFYKTLVLYLGVVISGTLLFYFVPATTLVLFVLVSGYHFGEQHFHYIDSENTFLKKLLYFSYGCSIIFLLLLTNSEKSIIIIEQITYVLLTAKTLDLAFYLSLFVFLLSFSLIFKKIKQPYRELFNLIVFFVVFKTASLIWAFAIYFVLWHSLPSLKDQIQYLFKEINQKNILTYVKSSFLYWLVSIIGLFLFFNFLVKESDMFYAIFFSFLAAITFPHVVVMTKIFKH